MKYESGNKLKLGPQTIIAMDVYCCNSTLMYINWSTPLGTYLFHFQLAATAYMNQLIINATYTK